MKCMILSVLYIALCHSASAVDVNVSGKLLAPACSVELPPDNMIALPDVSLAQLYKGEIKPTVTTIKVLCHKLTSVSFVLLSDGTREDGVVATTLAGIGLEINYAINLAGTVSLFNKPGESINQALLNDTKFIVNARPVITDESRAAPGNYAASALLSVEYR